MLATLPGQDLPDASKLLAQIEAAERVTQAHLKGFKEQVARYSSPAYSEDRSRSDFFPENHYFEWVSIVLPQIVFANPRVNVSSKRPGAQEVEAVAIEFGLNRWIKDSHLVRLNERLGVDFGFRYAVVATTSEPIAGSDTDDPDHRPQCSRIAQERFFMDSYATSDEDARFKGIKVVKDKDDLIREAETDAKKPESKRWGWDLEAVKALPVDDQLNELGRPKSDAPARNEVVYYEVWIPEIDLKEEGDEDDDYNGTVVRLAKGSNGAASYLCKPKPFYGPRTGPYTIIGAYTVPSEPGPLAPLVATEGQTKELNAHRIALSNAAARRKRIGLYAERDQKTAARILNCPDGGAVGIPGFDQNKFVEAEFGGVTDVGLAWFTACQAGLDRASGIHDVQRGNLAGGASATAVAVADKASSTRLDFLAQKFQDGIREMLTKVAWYLYKDDRILVSLDQETIQKIGLPAGFDGWRGSSKTAGKFEDLELEIEPYSMRRTDDAVLQARAMQRFQTAAQTIPLMIQAPWGNWEGLFADLAKAFNWPTGADVADFELARQIGFAMLQLNMQGQAEGGTSQGSQSGFKGQASPPRLSGDVGMRTSPTPSKKAASGFPGNQTGGTLGALAKQGVAA